MYKICIIVCIAAYSNIVAAGEHIIKLDVPVKVREFLNIPPEPGQFSIMSLACFRKLNPQLSNLNLDDVIPSGTEFKFDTSCKIPDVEEQATIPEISPGYSPWCKENDGKGCFAYTLKEPVPVSSTSFADEILGFFERNGYVGVTADTLLMPGRHIFRRDEGE